MRSQDIQEDVDFSAACSFCQLVAAVLVCAFLAVPASAQTFAVLHKFSGSDGSQPLGPLVQGLDGKFYGVTQLGGTSTDCPPGCGTIFKVGRYGAVTTLYNFCSQSGCADGGYPLSGMFEGVYGTLYGTTNRGGSTATSGGTVFKLATNEALTTLHNFYCGLTNCIDYIQPSPITLGWDGSFHGTTFYEPGVGGGHGSTYRLTPGGAFTTSYAFCTKSKCPDGENPVSLIQGMDGYLYGITSLGGVRGGGTVFKIGPGGFSTLYNFCTPTLCADGTYPSALIQGSDGNLYGTTLNGGVAKSAGTIFKLTTDGTLANLYTFCLNGSSCSDGSGPWSLAQGTDGNLYGTTRAGGNIGGAGTIFSITPGGTFTLLHRLEGPADGDGPSQLLQGTDGAFYGAAGGGSSSFGTIFRLDVGLGPFVRSVVPFGHVGDHVTLVGTNLTGVGAVSFNGTLATITAACETRIATTVPAGATSGPITVTTSTGTLTSNLAFTVLP